MFPLLLQFLALAAIVVAAGILLAVCADKLAEITQWGRLLVGSILLAGATSLPELSIDIAAVRMGMADLAIGDLLGSSLMNLLILAVLDLSTYSRGRMLSREAAGHALSGVMSMTLTAIVAIAMVGSQRIPTLTYWGLSLPACGLLAAYCLGVRMTYLDQRLSARAAMEQAEALPQSSSELPPWWQPSLGFVGTAAVLLLTGPHLSHTAGQLADATGLGKTFVGTVFVAVCTSLPELVATITTVRMGAYDLAIGNIFGSNTFNMVLFVPLDWFCAGRLFANAAPAHAITGLAAILATSIAVMGQLSRIERRRPLVEPDGWLVILTICGALTLVYRFA